jgi:hypothetical protein
MKETDQPKTDCQAAVDSKPSGQLWEHQTPRQGLSGDSERPEPGVNRHAWEHPGEFHVQKDSNGQVERIEGRLQLRHEPRSAADQRLQREAAAGAPTEGEQRMDGGHLIAHRLGGPTVDSHGEETARDNLVPMDSRLNRSHLNTFEDTIARELETNPERRLHLQVDISRDADGQAETITHRLFREGPDGQPQAHPIGEVVTNIRANPSQTLRTTETQYGADSAADFYHPSPRGTAPGIH